MWYPGKCKNCLCVKENCAFQNKSIEHTKCMLIVKRIFQMYTSLFDELTSIGFNLDESEVMKFCNLDEIVESPNPKP